MDRNQLAEYSTKRKISLMINTANAMQAIGLVVWMVIVFCRDHQVILHSFLKKTKNVLLNSCSQPSDLRTGLLLITANAVGGVLLGYLGIILNNMYLVYCFANLLSFQFGLTLGWAIITSSPVLYVGAVFDFFACFPPLWYWYAELFRPYVQNYKEQLERQKMGHSNNVV